MTDYNYDLDLDFTEDLPPSPPAPPPDPDPPACTGCAAYREAILDLNRGLQNMQDKLDRQREDFTLMQQTMLDSMVNFGACLHIARSPRPAREPVAHDSQTLYPGPV